MLRMKIVFFGNAPEKIAAIRYRIITFADRLSGEGHRCVICLPSSVALKDRLYEGRSKFSKLLYLFLVLVRRLGQIRHVLGADMVYFRGPVFDYGPPVIERIIRLLNPRMVFDIDDAIWEPAAHVTSPFLRFVDHGWVRKMCGMCAHAVVGNEYLAGYVRPLNPNITIIPTCIDMDKHRQKSYPAPGRTVILGWTGLKDNLGYMEIIAKVLRELAARHDLKLEVASGADYHLEGVRVENRRWTIEHEFDYLEDADIGLMPLKDTPRARGKCAFKALQYMGVGTPVVISPVGMNADVIEDGVTGFLADTPEEWRQKLEALITQPELRERMGRAAREMVLGRYSHEANYPKFKQMLETVAALRRQGPG
jgi:glycosyltransferase involved in cell wall biosynthesis